MRDQQDLHPPAQMVAGALAHLTRHLESGCLHSLYHAAMLFERLANDPEADVFLRHNASELAECLMEQDKSSTKLFGPPTSTVICTRPENKALA